MSHLLNVRDGIVIPEEADYKSFVSERPMYRLLKVAPTGGDPQPITNSSVDSYFEITPNVVNLSKSFLEYKVNIPLVAGRVIFSHMNKPNIQSIRIYTKSGINIVEADYVNKMIYAMGRKEMKMTNFLCRPSNSLCYTSYGRGVLFRADLSAITNQLDSTYLTAGASGAPLIYNVSFPLSDVVETLLSMDKDLYFKENLIVKITWEQNALFGFTGDDATGANPAALAVNPLLSNLQIKLAVQTNRKLIESTMALVESGLSLDIPFVTVLRNNTSNANMNVNVKINSGMGKTLVKVMHTIFSSTESSITAFDNSNSSVDGKTNTKVLSYYTQLNSQRLQDYNLNCSLVVKDANGNQVNDDYQWNQFYLKNSAIIDSEIYVRNWFHEDNWSSVNNNSSIKETQLATPGLPLDTELTWYFYGQAPGATSVNHHTIVVTRKTLTISPTGVSLK